MREGYFQLTEPLATVQVPILVFLFSSQLWNHNSLIRFLMSINSLNKIVGFECKRKEETKALIQHCNFCNLYKILLIADSAKKSFLVSFLSFSSSSPSKTYKKEREGKISLLYRLVQRLLLSEIPRAFLSFFPSFSLSIRLHTGHRTFLHSKLLFNDLKIVRLIHLFFYQGRLERWGPGHCRH